MAHNSLLTTNFSEDAGPIGADVEFHPHILASIPSIEAGDEIDNDEDTGGENVTRAEVLSILKQGDSVKESEIVDNDNA